MTIKKRISSNYCGPSRVIPLAHIRNQDGFKFIGIDKSGAMHFCIVRLDNKSNYYVMHSNTVTFQELIGWLPDCDEGEYVSIKKILAMRKGDCNADVLPSKTQRTLMPPDTSNRTISSTGKRG